MIRNQLIRHCASVALIVAGGLLMLLSTSIGAGLIVFSLGVVLELIGLALDRRSSR